MLALTRHCRDMSHIWVGESGSEGHVISEDRKQGLPRSRIAAFQCSRRSLMSWLTRASRPMLRIFCVVLMVLRGLVGSHRGPPKCSGMFC